MQSRISRALAIVAALTLAWAAPAAVAQEADPTGNWDMVVDMNGTPVEARLSVTDNGDGTLTAELTSMMGNAELTDVTFDAGKLAFTQTFGEGDAALEFKFEGQMEGDAFSGTLTSELGEMPVTGKRAKPAPMSVGVWDVLSDSQLGTNERVLRINDDWTGVYEADAPADISNLTEENGTVTFNVTVPAGGDSYALMFKGTVEGDSLKGQFYMEGNAVAELTGTRRAEEEPEAEPEAEPAAEESATTP
jgi:hypothetical protein